MVESAPLLREYTLIAYRGFESLSLRQKDKGPVGPLLSLKGCFWLFLKAIAANEQAPRLDQTRPWQRLEPSRKAAQPCKG